MCNLSQSIVNIFLNHQYIRTMIVVIINKFFLDIKVIRLNKKLNIAKVVFLYINVSFDYFLLNCKDFNLL